MTDKKYIIEYANRVKSVDSVYLKSVILKHFNDSNFLEQVNKELERKHSIYQNTLSSWIGSYESGTYVSIETLEMEDAIKRINNLPPVLIVPFEHMTSEKIEEYKSCKLWDDYRT